MKRFFKALIIVVLAVATITCCVACSGGGSTPTEKGVLYKKFSGDSFYTVYGYNGKDTAIDLGAFAKEKNVEIGKIKTGAFAGNSTIKSISVPTTVVEIETGAFKDMRALEEITLPFIGANANSDAFLGESKKTVDKAVDSARVFCYIFGTEQFDTGIEVTANYGGGTQVYYLPNSLKKVTVTPREGYSIPMYAFSGVAQLGTVVLSDKIDAIGEKAFENCTALNSVTLASSIKNIYNGAFIGTANLKTLSFSGLSLDGIYDKAFEGSVLESIEVAVKKVGDYAFSKSSLKTVNLSGVEQIGNYAFASCEKLEASNLSINYDNVTGVIFGVHSFDFSL